MFIIISNQIIKMTLLIILGFILCRIKMIDHHGNKTISNLLLMVVSPLLIIDAFQMDYTPQLMNGLLLSLTLGFLTHFVGIIIARFAIPSKNNPDCGLERFSCVYSNCGFMGIPLAQAIFGSEGVLYITTYMVTFNILVWTHGLMAMTGNFSLKQMKKGLTSPVIIGIVIGLALFIGRIRLPLLVGDTVKYMASLNTPLAMLVAGVSLGETDVIKALKNKRLYLVSFIKLLVIPLISIGLLFALPFDQHVLCTIILATACPAATTGTMFALRYNGNYRYASELFSCSTLLSMATIPAVIFIVEHIFTV